MFQIVFLFWKLWTIRFHFSSYFRSYLLLLFLTYIIFIFQGIFPSNEQLYSGPAWYSRFAKQIMTVMHAPSLLMASLYSSLISKDSKGNIPASLLQPRFQMSLMQVIMIIFNKYGPIIPVPKKWESSDHFSEWYRVMTIDISRVDKTTTRSDDFHYYQQDNDTHMSSNIPNLFYIIFRHITLNWYLEHVVEFLTDHTPFIQGTHLSANIAGHKDKVVVSGNDRSNDRRGFLKNPEDSDFLTDWQPMICVNDWPPPNEDEDIQEWRQFAQNVHTVSIPDFIEQVFETNTAILPSEHILKKVDSCFNTILKDVGANEIRSALRTPISTVSSLLGKNRETNHLNEVANYFFPNRDEPEESVVDPIPENVSDSNEIAPIRKKKKTKKQTDKDMAMVEFKQSDLAFFKAESLKSFAKRKGVVPKVIPKGSSKTTFCEESDLVTAAAELLNKCHEKTCRALAVTTIAEMCKIPVTQKLFKLINQKKTGGLFKEHLLTEKPPLRVLIAGLVKPDSTFEDILNELFSDGETSSSSSESDADNAISQIFGD